MTENRRFFEVSLSPGVRAYVAAAPVARLRASVRFDRNAGDAVVTLPLPGVTASLAVESPSLAAAGAGDNPWVEYVVAVGPDRASALFETPSRRRGGSVSLADILFGAERTEREVLRSGRISVNLPEGRVDGNFRVVQATTSRPRRPGEVVEVCTRIELSVPVAMPGGTAGYVKAVEYPGDQPHDAALQFAVDVVRARLHGWGSYEPPYASPETPPESTETSA